MAHEKYKWCVKIITEERINQSIASGAQTSKDIAEEMGVYRSRVQALLKKMADAEEVERTDIGGTFVYTLKEE